MIRSRAWWRSLAAVSLMAALSACGGGGGGSSTTPSTPAGPGAPTSAPVTPTSVPAGPTASGTVAISVPRYVSTSQAGRAPKFVSPATQSVSISLQSANGAAPATPYSTTSDLTATSPNCTNGSSGLQCAVPVTLPVGNDVLVLKTYSGIAQGGNLIGTATAPVTIAQNARNTLGVSVSGVVASLSAFLSNNGNFASGTASSAHLYIVALDSTGNIILGSGTSNATPTYDNPLTVTNTDSTGTFTTVSTGTTTAKTTILGPGDLIDVAYNGGTTASSASFTVSGVAPAGGGSAPQASFSASRVGAAVNSFIDNAHFFNGVAVQLSSLTDQGTVTVSGGTPPYTASTTGVATVSGASPTFTVGASAYGAGTVKFTDSKGIFQTRIVTAQATTPVTIALGSGSGSTGTSALITMASSGSSFQSVTFSGGDGSNYAVTVAGSSGGTGTSSQVISASGTGNSRTINASGLGTDYLVVKSGGQTATLQVNVSTALAVRVDTKNQANWNYGTSTLYLNQGFPGQGFATITPIGGSGQYATSLSSSGSCSYLTLNTLSSGSYGISPTGTGSTCVVTAKDGTGATGPAITIVSAPVITVTQSQSAVSAVTFQGYTAGQTFTQPIAISGGSGSYSCFSSNGTVASFSCTGASGTVTAAGVGGTLLAVNDTVSAIQVSIPVYVGPGGGFTVTAPSTTGVVAANDVNGRLHLAMQSGTAATLTLAGSNGTVSNPVGTGLCGTGISILGSGTNRTVATSAAASNCAFVFSDQLGQLAPFSVDVYAALTVTAAAVTNVSYIADTHGFTGPGTTGYQLEFLGTGSVAEIDVAQSSLAAPGICSALTASSSSDSVAKIGTAAGGPFTSGVPAAVTGFGGTTQCQIFVQPQSGGYGRITITDGNILTTGDRAATQVSLGVGVTTVTIPVLNRGRAR